MQRPTEPSAKPARHVRAEPHHNSDETFWSEIFQLHQSVTPLVTRRVLAFGGLALILTMANWWLDNRLAIDIGPYEIAGAVLGFLLVFRTNAGYDRWYEGRKMWGQIINQSRNLAITSLAHGPNDRTWCEQIVRWIAAFGHVSRASLRSQDVPYEVRGLLGAEAVEEIELAVHKPSFVALRIGEHLRRAVDTMGMDPFGFLQSDRERALLIEYEGCCERIRTTPVPTAYSINIRRLSFVYLLSVPFGLLAHFPGHQWLAVPVTMLIAYAVLAMDQIAVELQHPFDPDSLNHLQLEVFTAQIEADVLALVASDSGLQK